MIRALLAWLDRRIDGRIVARGYERFERERQALPPGTPMRAYYDEVARIGAGADVSRSRTGGAGRTPRPRPSPRPSRVLG
jgi:hypothetical protein